MNKVIYTKSENLKKNFQDSFLEPFEPLEPFWKHLIKYFINIKLFSFVKNIVLKYYCLLTGT